MKTAVILAAGMGTRFGKYSEIVPKGIVEFKGKGMVVRSIETLIEYGIEHIIVGTGYHKERYEVLASEVSSKFGVKGNVCSALALRKLTPCTHSIIVVKKSVMKIFFSWKVIWSLRQGLSVN